MKWNGLLGGRFKSNVRFYFQKLHRWFSYCPVLGRWATFFQTCAHILTKFLDHRDHQWVEQKRYSNHVFGSQPKLLLSPNCGSLFQVL